MSVRRHLKDLHEWKLRDKTSLIYAAAHSIDKNSYHTAVWYRDLHKKPYYRLLPRHLQGATNRPIGQQKANRGTECLRNQLSAWYGNPRLTVP
jgi:hypothetical protein